MTRAELLELLLVERHLPLPPVPKQGLTAEDGELRIPGDTRALQYMRRVELETAVESFDHHQHNKKRRSEAAPKLVKKGLIYVKEKAAA